MKCKKKNFHYRFFHTYFREYLISMYIHTYLETGEILCMYNIIIACCNFEGKKVIKKKKQTLLDIGRCSFLACLLCLIYIVFFMQLTIWHSKIHNEVDNKERNKCKFHWLLDKFIEFLILKI